MHKSILSNETHKEELNVPSSLPADIWNYSLLFLPTKSRAKLSIVNKYFKKMRDNDPLYPIYPIWNSFYDQVLKNNTLIDTSKITLEVEQEFCNLIKNTILNSLSRKEFDLQKYLSDSLMSCLWNITKEPQDDITHIKKLHEDPASAWSHYENCYHREDREPTQQELLALFIYYFRREFEKPLEEKNTKKLELSTKKLLHHILFGTDYDMYVENYKRYHRFPRFNFLSLKNTCYLLNFLPKEKSDSLSQSLLIIDSSQSDRKKIEAFKLYLLGRSFQFLFKEDFNNDKNILEVIDLINAELNKFIPPYFPIIRNKGLDGFQIRFNFSADSTAKAAKEKLEKVGISCKLGKVRKEFAVDITNIEPTELFIKLNSNVMRTISLRK